MTISNSCGNARKSSACWSRSGIRLYKYWFSVTREEQLRRFRSRENDPLKQWKLSPIDKASLDKWDEYTEAKEAMFFYTDTADAPWTIIKSDDKKRARLACMRHFLSTLPYPDKNTRWWAKPISCWLVAPGMSSAVMPASSANHCRQASVGTPDGRSARFALDLLRNHRCSLRIEPTLRGSGFLASEIIQNAGLEIDQCTDDIERENFTDREGMTILPFAAKLSMKKGRGKARPSCVHGAVISAPARRAAAAPRCW